MPVSQRLVDTRLTSPLAPGGSLSVSVTGAAPLPAAGTVTAAVLNLTVTAPFGAGYFTVWPHTSARPEASNLNIDELLSLAGGAVPNLVTVPVGSDGVVDVYSSGGGNVIVDLLGYYTAADTATAGRFESLPAPTRVMDTRRVATFAPGETRGFTIPGAAGANAVAVNLTSVTTRPGYWQVYPMGGAVPATSNLNSPAGRERRCRQPGHRHRRCRWRDQHLLRAGRRPDHRPRRHLHGRRRTAELGRPVRADHVADTDRRHPRPVAQPARRHAASRAGVELRGSRFQQPGDRAVGRLGGRAECHERWDSHHRLHHGGNRRCDGSR